MSFDSITTLTEVIKQIKARAGDHSRRIAELEAAIQASLVCAEAQGDAINRLQVQVETLLGLMGQRFAGSATMPEKP
jgi:hypothetical protein